MNKRRQLYGTVDYQPTANVDQLFPGTFYLKLVDKKGRRQYSCKEESPEVEQALKRLNSVTAHLTSNNLDDKVAKTIASDFHKKSVAQRQQTVCPRL